MELKADYRNENFRPFSGQSFGGGKCEMKMDLESVVNEMPGVKFKSALKLLIEGKINNNNKYNNFKKYNSVKNIDNDYYEDSDIGGKKHANGNIEYRQRGDNGVEGGDVEDGEIFDCGVNDDDGDLYDEIFNNNANINNSNSNNDIKNVEKGVENKKNNDEKLEKTYFVNKKNVVDNCENIDNGDNNKGASGTNDLTKTSNSRSRSSSSSSSDSSSSSGSNSSSSSSGSSSSGSGSSKSSKSKCKGRGGSSSNIRKTLEGFTKEIDGMKNELTVKETRISELHQVVENLKNEIRQQNTKIEKLSNRLSNHERNIGTASKCESSNTRSILDPLPPPITKKTNNKDVPRSSNAVGNNNNTNNHYYHNSAYGNNYFVDSDIVGTTNTEEAERKRKSDFPNFPPKMRRVEFREDLNDNKEYRRHIDETHSASQPAAVREQYKYRNNNKYGEFFGVVLRDPSIIDVKDKYEFESNVNNFVEGLKKRYSNLWVPAHSRIYRYKHKDSAVLQFNKIAKRDRFFYDVKGAIEKDPHKRITNIYVCSFDFMEYLKDERKNNQIERFWENPNGGFSVSFHGEPTPNIYTINIPCEYFNIKKNREFWKCRYRGGVGVGGCYNG